MSGREERQQKLRAYVCQQIVFSEDEQFWGLTVTDVDGCHPVVTALAEERLGTLVQRIRNTGGFANVFIGMPGEIVRVSVSNKLGAPETDRMTGVECPSLTDSVGVFMDYLAKQPGGVVMPVAAPVASVDTPRVVIEGRVPVSVS